MKKLRVPDHAIIEAFTVGGELEAEAQFTVEGVKWQVLIPADVVDRMGIQLSRRGHLDRN